MHWLASLFSVIALTVGSWFGAGTAPVAVTSTSAPAASAVATATTQNAAGAVVAPVSTGQHVYTQAELLAMADNTYANGAVPLGDNKYVTDAPKKGYVYLCNVHKDNPGSMVNGPWISGMTWNFLQKVAVDGSVSWPQASFTNIVSGASRILTGNDLPINHTTGVFPVSRSSEAGKYDPNPNTISAQTLSDTIPANPTYSDTPYCMGGEVGVMTSGVALFDAFDAGLRDAPAHELQDSCDGHPQGSGEYHYHSLSSCFKDIGEQTVLGYAFDGFPITGPEVAPSKFLTTDDLDECHGITSQIIEDGKAVTTYHYVMTQDFPYSVSCFRGKPSTYMAVGGGLGSQQGQQNQQGSQQEAQSQGQQGGPPQAAITACSGKSVDAACSFSTPNGTVSGACRVPPGATLACVP